MWLAHNTGPVCDGCSISEYLHQFGCLFVWFVFFIVQLTSYGVCILP